MVRNVKSLFIGTLILILCVIEFKARNVPHGHVIFRLTDRPLSIIILGILGILAYWGHQKQHTAVRNMAIGAILFVVL